jgi:hypothetical protein
MLFTSTMPTHAEKNRGRRVLFPLKRANNAAFGLYDRAAGHWGALCPAPWLCALCAVCCVLCAVCGVVVVERRAAGRGGVHAGVRVRYAVCGFLVRLAPHLGLKPLVK